MKTFKRPLFAVGAGLLLAVRVSFFVIPTTALSLALVLAATAGVALLLGKGQYPKVAILALACGIGLSVGGAHQHRMENVFWPAVGKTVKVAGFVRENTPSGRGQRLTLDATFPESDLPDTPLVVRDYGGRLIRAGEWVELEGVFQLPRYENVWRFYQRQGVPGEVILQELEFVGAPPSLSFSQQVESRLVRLRQHLWRVNRSLYPKETAALVNGMVFGMTDDLAPSLYSDLNRSGTSHLLSVSGLHLSIVTSAALFLFSALGVGHRLKYLLGAGVAGGFTLLVGAGPPIFRSCVMILFYFAGQLLSEKSDSLTSLGVAGGLIALWRPYWVLSYGLWLSFLSTFGIVVFSGPMSAAMKERYPAPRTRFSLRSAVLSSLAITLSAYVCTLPVLVFLNGEIPLISPLANVLVGPFSTVVVVLGAFLPLVPRGFPLLPLLCRLVDFCGRMVVGISQCLARLPYAALALNTGAHVVAVGLTVGLVLAGIGYYRRRGKKGVLALVLAGSVFLLGGAEILHLLSAQQVELITIEESIPLLVRGQTGVLLTLPDRYQMRTVEEYLRFRGIQRLDLVVADNFTGTTSSSLQDFSQREDVGAVVGPRDSAACRELSNIFHGRPVYSAENCRVTVLGGVEITLLEAPGQMEIRLADQSFYLDQGKCDILSTSPGGADASPGKEMVPPPIKPLCNPLATGIYGERRVVIG